MFWISMVLVGMAMILSLAFVAKLKPNSTGAWLFFATWLCLPYAIMAIVLMIRQRRRQTGARQTVAVGIAVVAGVLMLADIIIWHPDAQGAIAVLMVPPIQFVLWVIMAFAINKLGRA